MLHARNRGVHAIFIHALSENTAMLKIAKAAGASVEREGSESEAWLAATRLRSPAPDEFLGEHAAELDYRLKRQAHRPEALPTEPRLLEEDSPGPGESAAQPSVEAGR
jgi:hypothetical protein